MAVLTGPIYAAKEVNGRASYASRVDNTFRLAVLPTGFVLDVDPDFAKVPAEHVRTPVRDQGIEFEH